MCACAGAGAVSCVMRDVKKKATTTQAAPSSSVLRYPCLLCTFILSLHHPMCDTVPPYVEREQNLVKAKKNNGCGFKNISYFIWS